jgi:hypothetical protein
MGSGADHCLCQSQNRTGIAIKGGCLLGDPIHYAVLFSGSLGNGIEMVQALDEAHAVDIVLAQHPDAHVKAVPTDSIEGMNKHRLLFSWLESL